VDVSAPGHEVFAATKGSAYDSVSGTSFAAPLVAGAAALVSSILGDVSPVTIAQLLKSTMDPLGDGLVGRLNLARAVREALSRRGLASSLPLLRIVEGSLDGTLAVRSDDTPSSVHSTSIGEAGMADLDLSPDGDRVFGLRWDGMVVALRRAGAGTGDAPVSAASLALGHDPIVSGKIRISSDGRSAVVLTVRHSDPEPVVLSIWVLDIADTGEDLLLSVRAGYPIRLPQRGTVATKGL